MSDTDFGRLTDPPATLLLVGVRVLDPASGTDEVRDVGIVEGLLADPATVPAHAERIEGDGLVVAPGFVDLHAHLREPGGESSETIESGTRAAVRGGFTTVCVMPNTDPPLDTPERVRSVAAHAESASCRVRVIGAATRGRAGEALADLDDLARSGVVGISDDGASVPDALVRDAMSAVRPRNIPLVEHAEDPALADGAVMRAGAAATRLGLAGWPAETEARVVERDIAMAVETGARLHLTHLSSREAVEAVRRAKARGTAVTADVTPHHLAMTDAWVAGSRRFSWEAQDELRIDPQAAYDGSCRVNPPLPSRQDASALMEGLRDRTIDAIATDHAPHPPQRKLVPFGEAAPGLIGLETALSIGLAAVRAGQLELRTLLAAMCSRPAEIIGEKRSLEVGAPADLVAFNANASWRVERSTLASKSANTPLLGLELPGIVRLTVADGRVTYRS